MDVPYLLRAALGVPDYWHPALEIQPDFLAGRVGRYPVSMIAKAEYPGRLNCEGVPIVVVDHHSYVSPVTVALYGLGNYDQMVRSKDERSEARFTTAVEWFRRHAVQLGEGIGWGDEQDFALYGLKAPWFSALTQGLVLSLFVRAHQLNPGAGWSLLAQKTSLGYRLPVEQGGFRRKIGSGAIYEEYPGPELHCVFNGMCIALIGLWEAWQSGVAPEAKSDFEEGVNGLRSLLPQFLHGRWSLYSLNRCLGRPLLSSPYYQKTNGLTAQIIGLMSRDPEFEAYGNRWLESCSSLRCLTMSMRIGVERYLYGPELLRSSFKAQS